MSTSSNMVLIETKTVAAGGAANIEFTGIPQTGYTDLQIVFSGRTNRSTGSADPDLINLKFNDSTTTFSTRILTGTGSSPFSESKSTAEMAYGFNPTDSTLNTFSNGTIYIPNYTGSTNKSWSMDAVTENNGTYGGQTIGAGLWSTTSAINKITIYPSGSRTLLEYSTASLYGIKSLAKVKASGGNIYRINGYIYHEFLASGTFTPVENISNVEYLVIAGGGGASKTTNGGGGGGAGGYRCSVTGESSGGGASAESKISVTAGTPYTVTIGAGGSASAKGSDSVFGAITALGGGTESATAGTRNGGSGAGAVFGGTAGSGTTSQGYGGGTGASVSGEVNGGGGGGANAAGSNSPSSTVAGNGGAGISSSITGTAVTRAGGGGGGVYSNFGTRTAGTGGTGGGGNGAVQYLSTINSQPQSGTANTGGGAGGCTVDSSNSNGGSGIVIVRYAV